MSKEEIREIRYYSYQDNILNKDFLKIGECYFRLDKISFISQVSPYYKKDEIFQRDGSSFNIICDCMEYKIIVDEDKIDKVYDRITKEIFSEDEDEDIVDKKYI